MKSRHRFISKKKPLSKNIKISIALSAVSVVAFAVCVIISAVLKDGGAYVGAIGLASMLLAFYGCFLGIKQLSSAKRADPYILIGSISGGVIFILWLAVFLIGVK